MTQLLVEKDLRQRVEEIPFWWHSIDLGGGVVTPGRKTPSILAKELANFQLPDLRGRTVLDIGAWDGFYSFHAERLGAKRVVALDHYVWSVNWGLDSHDPLTGTPTNGLLTPDQNEQMWRPQELPGKRGFDLAHEVLKSSVEPIVADYMTCDLQALGQFDVVFYFGVLYHMRHPLLALERLAKLTREVAVIETQAIEIPFTKRSFCEFFETNELGNDPTNWWAPNARALVGLCRAAGFRKVDILVKPPRIKGLFSQFRRLRYRLTAHAYK